MNKASILPRRKALANLVDGEGTFIRKFYVPVLFDTAPELPFVVELGKDICILSKQNPATYKWCGEPYKATEGSMTNCEYCVDNVESTDKQEKENYASIQVEVRG